MDLQKLSAILIVYQDATVIGSHRANLFYPKLSSIIDLRNTFVEIRSGIIGRVMAALVCGTSLASHCLWLLT